MAEARLDHREIGQGLANSVRRERGARVDTRALAERLLKDRPAPQDARIQTLKSRFNLDANKTLADLSPRARDDSPTFGDQPTAGALRHVPLGRLLPSDLAILLMHRECLQQTLQLCVEVLSQSPLLEAQYYAGDLLKAAAQRVSTPSNEEEASQFQGLRAPFLTLCAKAAVHAWDHFETEADRLHISPDARMTHRKRVARGERAPAGDPFWKTVDQLNVAAEARSFLQPLDIEAVAQAVVTYARYRPMSGLEPVPLEDLEDPAMIEHLNGPNTFFFERETEFVLAKDPDREGWRLHHFANAATMHHLGIAFESVSDAKQFAADTYGIREANWLLH